LVLPQLQARVIGLLLRVNKTMLCAVLSLYLPARKEMIGVRHFLVPREELFMNARLRRDSILRDLYAWLMVAQLRVSLLAAHGGLFEYQATSTARVFSIERIFGNFYRANMTTCRWQPTPKKNGKGAQPLAEEEHEQRLGRAARRLRCVRCKVDWERRRYLWSFGLGATADHALPGTPAMGTRERVLLGMRHRYIFREDKRRWNRVDNLRRMLLVMHNGNITGNVQSRVVDVAAQMAFKRVRAAVTHSPQWEGLLQVDHFGGCKSTLRKMIGVYPLAPGTLALLHRDSLHQGKRILGAWRKTQLCAEGGREDVDASVFLASEPLAPVRVVLQITGELLHGARVMYVHRADDEEGCECTVTQHSDFITFRAHDGRHELCFSTECESFMRLLDQALVAQELDEEFQLSSRLSPQLDLLRTWTGEAGGDASVLANYVVACSVHPVQDVAHVCFADVFDEDIMYTSVVHDLRLYDFELLDTKMPYTSTCCEHSLTAGAHHLSCYAVVRGMELQHSEWEHDAGLLAEQTTRGYGDMESDSESSTGTVNYSED